MQFNRDRKEASTKLEELLASVHALPNDQGHFRAQQVEIQVNKPKQREKRKKTNIKTLIYTSDCQKRMHNMNEALKR